MAEVELLDDDEWRIAVPAELRAKARLNGRREEAIANKFTGRGDNANLLDDGMGGDGVEERERWAGLFIALVGGLTDCSSGPVIGASTDQFFLKCRLASDIASEYHHGSYQERHDEMIDSIDFTLEWPIENQLMAKRFLHLHLQVLLFPAHHVSRGFITLSTL
mgnify:CR=1 FL=1